MDKITVSAPGKLMLFGEHSAVYGYPCLVSAINRRLKLEIQISDKDSWLDKKFTETAVNLFREKYSINTPYTIKIDTDLETKYGLGSSSAITVATLFGLYQISYNKDPDPKELFDLCFQTVVKVQNTASGFDLAAAIWGGLIYFVFGGKVMESLAVDSVPLLVAYSGVKADTVTMINRVKELKNDHQEGVEEIFKSITKLVDQAKVAILEKDWIRFGTLMNFNQDYLEDLGVSTEKLNDMISAANNAGAFGAKLSGAGGGDCMIALVPEEKRKDISDAITKAGGQVLDVKMEKEGVRIE